MRNGVGVALIKCPFYSGNSGKVIGASTHTNQWCRKFEKSVNFDQAGAFTVFFQEEKHFNEWITSKFEVLDRLWESSWISGFIA